MVFLAELVHSVFIDVLGVVLITVCAIEMSRALAHKYAKPYLLTIFSTAGAAYAGKLICDFLYPQIAVNIYFGVLLLGALTLLIVQSVSKNREVKNRLYASLFVLAYPVSILSFIFALNGFSGVGYNTYAVGFALLVASGSDIFAFIFGVSFKGPKLAPKISPKKTVSGAVGGLVGGLIAATLVYFIAEYAEYTYVLTSFKHLSPDFGINIMHYIVLGLVGSVCTQAGDLFASYIKRKCEIKDFGNLLPGHGGLLDRVDGFMFVSVFFFVYLAVVLSFA